MNKLAVERAQFFFAYIVSRDKIEKKNPIEIHKKKSFEV